MPYAFVALILLVMASTVQARLAPSSFDEMVQDSSDIVLARAIKLTLDQTGGGQAKFVLDKAIKGKLKKDAYVTLMWTAEEHDQAIPQLSAVYLLFLVKGKGEYTGTHYGRSYFQVRGPKKFVEYAYPISIINFPQSLQPKKITTSIEQWPKPPRQENRIGFLLEDMLKYIRIRLSGYK